MNYKTLLSGTGVAIITPFDEHKNIDFKALEKSINHIIKGGCQYIVSLGTTGETPVLTKAEKQLVIDFTVKVVKNRVPIVVGVGGNNTASVIDELNSLNIDGALAVLSASPYYNKPSQEGIYQHYKALASASKKPIILYNVPGRTGRNMSVATTLRLAALDNIIGIKEASGDMAQCIEILKNRPKGFLVVSGDDALALPQLACGMEGVISVAANAYPKQFSKMINLCLQENYKKAVEVNNKLTGAYDLMFAENNPAGVKAFMAEMGIIKNQLRLPGVPVEKQLQEKISAFVKQF